MTLMVMVDDTSLTPLQEPKRSAAKAAAAVKQKPLAVAATVVAVAPPPPPPQALLPVPTVLAVPPLTPLTQQAPASQWWLQRWQ